MSEPTPIDRLAADLLQCWSTTDEPWDSNGSFDLPGGGYVQWTRVAESGSDVHVEINEGGDYDDPMPQAIVRALTEIGWREPDDQFRNCWLRVGRPDGDDGPPRADWFGPAAAKVLRGVSLVREAMAGETSRAATELMLSMTRDERGFSRRSICLESDGSLVIEGHDLGPGVSDSWGASEYEFARTVGPAGVAELRRAADLGDAPLLEAIRDRFGDTSRLERFLQDHRIESSLWSRIGD